MFETKFRDEMGDDRVAVTNMSVAIDNIGEWPRGAVFRVKNVLMTERRVPTAQGKLIFSRATGSLSATPNSSRYK